MGKLFGTDGVRGVANTELTPELAFSLGRAGAYILTKESKHAPRIIVGRDTRISGHMLEAALTAGMCSIGAEVYHAGVIPTPGIAYLVKKNKLDAGVVISASHNPVADNGIKFFSGNGYKLPDELEDEIEKLICNGLEDNDTSPKAGSKDDGLPRPDGLSVGRGQDVPEMLDEYVEYLKSTLDGNTLEGIKLAIDCANGATYKAAPKVFEGLGCDVRPLHNMPDGTNINLKCGSTHIDSLIQYASDNKMDIGLAFDGDGDRVLAVDDTGRVVDGDAILAICGKYLKERNELSGNTIVATVMSNMGLTIMGKAHGIDIMQAAVGDRYVLEKMLEKGYCLGGEQSGHIIFLKHSTTGDGIMIGLFLLRIMKETGKSLSELRKIIETLPQVLVNVRVQNEKKDEYLTNEDIRREVGLLERKFAGQGRILIRPSGTEPLLRVMIEGRDMAEIQAEAERIAGLLELHLG